MNRTNNNIFNFNGNPEFTPLEIAVVNRNMNEVNVILNRNVRRKYLLSRKNAFGNPIMYHAIDSGSPNMVRLLLRKGANVNKGGHRAPLTHALEMGKIPIARILIDAGANINIDNGGPLRAAAEHGHMGMVKLLIRMGAHVNRKDDLGRTALYLASEKGHLMIVKVLLEHGSIPFIGNFFGKTPADVASNKKIENIIRKWPGERSARRRMTKASLNSVRNRQTGQRLHIPNNVKQQILSYTTLSNKNQFGRWKTQNISEKEVRIAWEQELKRRRKRKRNNGV